MLSWTLATAQQHDTEEMLHHTIPCPRPHYGGHCGHTPHDVVGITTYNIIAGVMLKHPHRGVAAAVRVTGQDSSETCHLYRIHGLTFSVFCAESYGYLDQQEKNGCVVIYSTEN
jgi:hypothetical protein